MGNPFDLRSPTSEERVVKGAVLARNRVLERERDHARAMHRLRVVDPAAAREAALWARIADEIDAYLAPPLALASALPFEAEEIDWGPP